MSQHVFRVEGTALGRAMVNRPTCDACGVLRECNVAAIAECCPGDEIEGCNMLAIDINLLGLGWGQLQRNGNPPEDYCQACWQRIAPPGVSLDGMFERADILRVLVKHGLGSLLETP